MVSSKAKVSFCETKMVSKWFQFFLFETIHLVIFGQILPMKPSIFTKWFQDFPKKKIVETMPGFKKTVQNQNTRVR